MTASDLMDRVAAYAASEKMRNGRIVAWTSNIVAANGRYLAAVTVDDVLIVREESDRLYRAIDRACVSFGEWRSNLEMLERSVKALRGTASGNTNEARTAGVGGSR